MIEVNCETDFVARNDEFRQLAKDLALQVVAARPLCVRREEVPADALAEQKQVFIAQAADKPENIREKIAEGKLNAWYGEVVLLDQKFVKDEAKTIREMIQEVNARTGENISVSRFARFVVGEASRPAANECDDDRDAPRAGREAVRPAPAPEHRPRSNRSHPQDYHDDGRRFAPRPPPVPPRLAEALGRELLPARRGGHQRR